MLDTPHSLIRGPVLPIPQFAAGSRDRQIENIRSNRLAPYKGAIFTLTPIDWGRHDNSTVSTQIHGLVAVAALLGAEEKMPDDVAVLVGDHIADWARVNLNDRTVNPFAWYEGAVMKRQATMLHAVNYLRRHGNVPHLDPSIVLGIIEANVSFLLDEPDAYTFGNHGIRQDIILAATALSMPAYPRSQEMLDLAHRRLEQAAEDLFTPSGVWKEHASGYVHYALRLMQDAKKLSDAAPTFSPSRFLACYDASLSYLLDCLAPDHGVPPIGASATTSVKSAIAEGDQIEAHLRSKERSLSAYSDYGHAIIRGDHPSGLYLLFTASQHLPTPKRHADELSFILWNFGRVWITEGGHETYEPGPISRYLRSSLAHNGYVKDGRPFPERGHTELDAAITRAEETGEGIILHGFSDRFRGGCRVERTISIPHDFQSILVADSLPRGRFTGRLHFPGDLSVEIADGKVVVRDADRHMVLRFNANTPLTFATVKGQKEPMAGWGRNADGFGPVTTLTWVVDAPATVGIDIFWY